MKFSLSPGVETGFSQWLDAMKMVAQLPGGMPSEFRTKLWLQLSEKHLNDQNVDWAKAEAVIFNEWANPDDEELGVQIVKDLHRTGCSLFCGEQEHNQALLKRVLLAYARWNKNVGYCQGFNMLAALILQVMDKDEKNAVKVMIYLIEGVLPESYFANNLRGLSVDMAVFRDLLRLRLPKLSKHLEALQHDTNSGTSYEPPLTNVFTMQWFLTLFSNCLPQQTVLRVWDLVFLYGNEVLLRTALAIWGILQDRVITVESADEFYSIMGVVTREMLEFGLMDANTLVKTIAMVDPFPNELQELREKYLYNISPWTQSVQSAAKKGIRLFYSDPDDQDDTEDEDKIALATAYGVFRRRESTSKELQVTGPTLDISVLKQQYAKLRQRQRQAHVIITAACTSNLPGNLGAGPSVSVNHLLMGKSALVNKGRRIGPPEGSIPPLNNKKVENKSYKPKIIISGETFDWKDAEKRKVSKFQIKTRSNKKEILGTNEKNRMKAEDEEHKMKTNHDRIVKNVMDKPAEESVRENEAESESSSTSTELCDEEFHRISDFDSEDNSDASSYHLQESFPNLRNSSPETPSKHSPIPGVNFLENGGCDKDKLKDIKNFAISIVNEIEEKIQMSEKLKRQKKSKEHSDVNIKKIDNTLVKNNQLFCDNIIEKDPEVPIKEVKEEKEKDVKNVRRKSDLGLSVIKENLEMLHKFALKNSEKTMNRSFELERETEEDMKQTKMKWSTSFQGNKDEIICDEIDISPLLEQKVQKSAKTEVKQQLQLNQQFLVEKAISPIVEKKSKAEKVNKEVNTEITFGVDEVEISTAKSKLQEQDDIMLQPTLVKERLRGEEECPVSESSRRSRESLFRDEIKQQIESSKSDWELKMKKIAELETTTREALNQIQARSVHRKSLHRSLDRTTKRTYLEETTVLPKIELEATNSTEEESNYRKLKTSARSFDAITSRTEKLLSADFNRSADEIVYKRSLSPEFGCCKTKGSASKYTLQEDIGSEWKSKTRAYEFYSSPTSPEYNSNLRYSDYLAPNKYTVEEQKYKDEDFVRITQNGSKTSVDLKVKRIYSPESETNRYKSSFNPFPTRLSRPKDLGVKLGLYSSSPDGPSFKKS